jgi:holo-[acyl-carrier protein] synthase
MQISSGVDILEVERMKRAVDQHGERFLNRIFTEQEQTYCEGNCTRLAGRFAIKEAVAKALGTGIGDLDWRHIEVINNERGKPELFLHERAAQLAEKLGLTTWSVSMSHTTAHAIGFAVATGPKS